MMQKPYNTLLIDDEKLALSRLAQLLSAFPGVFDIIGEANNGLEGLALIESMKPDLIFLDIEMPLMNGFEMLKRVKQIPTIVFVTAFDEYAIRAFEENSIDYLLKPVEKERLERTIQKLENFKKPSDQTIQLLQLIESVKPKRALLSIPIKVGDQILLVRTEEVVFLEAEDKYVYVHTVAGKKHLIDHTIAAMEEKLPDYFMRISRSTIINKLYVKKVERHFNGRYVLFLGDKQELKITSGSHFADNIKKLISI